MYVANGQTVLNFSLQRTDSRTRGRFQYFPGLAHVPEPRRLRESESGALCVSRSASGIVTWPGLRAEGPNEDGTENLRIQHGEKTEFIYGIHAINWRRLRLHEVEQGTAKFPCPDSENYSPYQLLAIAVMILPSASRSRRSITSPGECE